ncbi:C1 family peptidase [Roseofilum sp. BLCC_M91]|uniref:C1 family peptidase n=1 Tax=Roseofilum halophilum BLCC-M91 TaxID=3022259 RepID=A0ABT7BQ73_9CYAN|nr:C1 family peptidase [Roseofilum halophilum]MDJ1180443.1 C1 family peptidase [Roseofilum halophilum BLCC-M91]
MSGTNVQLTITSPLDGEIVVLNGSLNQQGQFSGTATYSNGAGRCRGRSSQFKLVQRSGTPIQPQPQNIDKQNFRKSDEQAAAELAALRQQGQREGWTFNLGDSLAFRILLEVLAGTRIPDNFSPIIIDIARILALLIQQASQNNPTPAPPAPTPPAPQPRPQPNPNQNQLPSRFDAREWNVVPRVRHQGGCGSCWAFAGISSHEIAYSSRYQYPSNSLNLSEQQLLSCNPQGYSCEGGFVTEDDSHYRYQSGVVTEQVYPYEEEKTPCRRLSPPRSGNIYNIRAFDFILSLRDNPGSQPNITKIKQGIYTSGSVWVGMATNEAFQAYQGGVFNACSTSKPDHAVNLIGWDDAGGYWIARNSWGDDWGENGYFRIKYGCSQIGASAAIPRLPELQSCNNGNCRGRAAVPPPWLKGSSAPVAPPPVQPAPVSPPPAQQPAPPSNEPSPGWLW